MKKETNTISFNFSNTLNQLENNGKAHVTKNSSATLCNPNYHTHPLTLHSNHTQTSLNQKPSTSSPQQYNTPNPMQIAPTTYPSDSKNSTQCPTPTNPSTIHKLGNPQTNLNISLHEATSAKPTCTPFNPHNNNTTLKPNSIHSSSTSSSTKHTTMKPTSSPLKTIKSTNINSPRTTLNPSKSVDFFPNLSNPPCANSITTNLVATKIGHETTSTFNTPATNNTMDEGRVKKIITSINENVQQNEFNRIPKKPKIPKTTTSIIKAITVPMEPTITYTITQDNFLEIIQHNLPSAQNAKEIPKKEQTFQQHSKLSHEKQQQHARPTMGCRNQPLEYFQPKSSANTPNPSNNTNLPVELEHLDTTKPNSNHNISRSIRRNATDDEHVLQTQHEQLHPDGTHAIDGDNAGNCAKLPESAACSLHSESTFHRDRTEYDILASKQHGDTDGNLELILIPTNELLRLVNATSTRHTGGHLLTRSGGPADQRDTNVDKSIISYVGYGNNTRTERGGTTKRQRAKIESHNAGGFPNLHSSRK
ncbi:putative serine/threonine-protein kinase nek3 [Capsicum galapagoense]